MWLWNGVVTDADYGSIELCPCTSKPDVLIYVQVLRLKFINEINLDQKANISSINGTLTSYLEGNRHPISPTLSPLPNMVDS